MIVSSGCSVFGIRSGYKQLSYSIIQKIEDVEIRQYSSRLVAEVNNIETDNEAFRILFRYISGQNKSKQNISMTAPVEVGKNSTKIAMTAPVETNKSEGEGFNMRFFLPSSLTIDNAPLPKDARIKINILPEETFAAITYSGFNSNKSFNKQTDKLLNILKNSNWKQTSPPSFLGYDPPFAIPFLRKNEAIVKVDKK